MAEDVQGARQGAGELSPADLIERSAELKAQLVAFAQSARFDRWLTPLLLGAAGPARRLDQGEAIRLTDHFVLRYRLPDGSTVVDRFVAGRKDLPPSEREMLLGWRDPVEGIFEIQRKDGDAVVLLNLVDDMEYRTYSNVGRSQRTCPMVFDMEDSAQRPPLLEPLFHAGSKIGCQPVMNLDDLRVGLGDMKR
ncbi:hypothetical protein [Streptomyces atroolivaceus]|uniref:hypothetical protein n=1 Tax=Streptomyces atroolivaceus TaxID=66869 RepID=UPI00363E6A11